MFSYLVKNAADTLYFRLAIFTPKNDITGIYSNAISHQRGGYIIQTEIKIVHYTTY